METPTSACSTPALSSEASNVLESPTEAELRKQYEDSEIKRFLRIFSTYVIEVKSTQVSLADAEERPPTDSTSTFQSFATTCGAPDTTIPSEEGLVRDIEDAKASREPSLTEYVAKHYIAPLLPHRQHEVGPFTLTRLRLTVNRLYIVAQIHLPHIKAFVDLALWTNYERSFFGCIIFWLLWWYNLLLPGLMVWMIYGVLRRGVLPYPTVQDLRDHHSRILQADQFSATLSDRLLTPSSTLDFKEIWRLLQLARMDWKPKSKPPKSDKKDAKESKDEKYGATFEKEEEPDTRKEIVDADISDDTGDLSIINDVPNLKRYILHILIEILDFHERLRNIAIWRNPAASKRYSLILLGALIITALVPAQYLAKGTYAAFGLLYWHGVPLLYALPSADRQRMPPLLGDVPTDAEYAMQLISERVAKGEDVQALLKDKSPERNSQTPPKLPPRPGSGLSKAPGKLRSIGKFIGDEGARLAQGHAPQLASNPLWNGAMAVLSPGVYPDLHTYTAQRGTSPGLITLTPKRLLFTPVVTSQLKADIDVESITGVKKSGVFRGLQVSYIDPETRVENEEKFHWVNGRDELFARLVGYGKQKWRNV